MSQVAASDSGDLPVCKAGAQALADFINAVNRDVADEPSLKGRIAVFREGRNFTSQLKLAQDTGWFGAFVHSVLSQGISVVVNDIALTAPACRAVEAATGVPADWVMQQNLYITPPEVQGFSPHCDVHTVVVAQLFGRKEWAIYDKALDNPVMAEGQKETLFPEPGESLAIRRRFTVEPGDVFVIPRGLFHDACARDGCSAHLAIGCAGIRPIDCIWALAGQAVGQSQLRADMSPAAAAKAAGDFLARAAVPLATLPRNPQAAIGSANGLQTLSFEESLRAVPGH
ncbi:MAG: hypothetical protein RL477_276 [Pseudomonadota bacterium]